MSTVTLYKVTCTKAYVASSELGTGYSLSPWGDNTMSYEGYDDGGKEYALPDGYSVGCDANFGSPRLCRGDSYVDILTHSSGRPQLVSGTDADQPVLRRAVV